MQKAFIAIGITMVALIVLLLLLSSGSGDPKPPAGPDEAPTLAEAPEPDVPLEPIAPPEPVEPVEPDVPIEPVAPPEPTEPVAPPPPPEPVAPPAPIAPPPPPEPVAPPRPPAPPPPPEPAKPPEFVFVDSNFEDGSKAGWEYGNLDSEHAPEGTKFVLAGIRRDAFAVVGTRWMSKRIGPQTRVTFRCWSETATRLYVNFNYETRGQKGKIKDRIPVPAKKWTAITVDLTGGNGWPKLKVVPEAGTTLRTLSVAVRAHYKEPLPLVLLDDVRIFDRLPFDDVEGGDDF